VGTGPDHWLIVSSHGQSAGQGRLSRKRNLAQGVCFFWPTNECGAIHPSAATRPAWWPSDFLDLGARSPTTQRQTSGDDNRGLFPSRKQRLPVREGMSSLAVLALVWPSSIAHTPHVRLPALLRASNRRAVAAFSTPASTLPGRPWPRRIPALLPGPPSLRMMLACLQSGRGPVSFFCASASFISRFAATRRVASEKVILVPRPSLVSAPLPPLL